MWSQRPCVKVPQQRYADKVLSWAILKHPSYPCQMRTAPRHFFRRTTLSAEAGAGNFSSATAFHGEIQGETLNCSPQIRCVETMRHVKCLSPCEIMWHLESDHVNELDFLNQIL